MLSAFSSPALQALEQYPSQKANQQLLRQQRQEAKDLRQAIQRTPWWSKTLMVLPNNGRLIPHKWPCSWRTWWSGLILGPFSEKYLQISGLKHVKMVSRGFFPEDPDPLMAGSPSAKESGKDTKALEGRKMYGYPVGGNQGGGWRSYSTTTVL